MPRVGLYRRNAVKRVMPSARYNGGATAANYGGIEGRSLRDSGSSLQAAGNSMVQDAVREKRAAEMEQKQQEREAKAAAKEAQYEAEKAMAVRDEALGRDASNAFQKELRELEREMYQREGKDALNVYKSGSEQIDGLWKKHSTGLSDKQLKNFSYYSGRRYNSSLDNLSKFDLAAQKSFEIKTLNESITGNTNDLVGSRYDLAAADVVAENIANDSFEIAGKQGMGEAETKNFIRTTLQNAHLQALNTMMEDGEYDRARAYLDHYKGDMTEGVYASMEKDIYEKGVLAKAPQLVKGVLAEFPDDLAAQSAALDKIEDEKLRGLTRKELVVQRQIENTKKQQQEQQLYEEVLKASFLREDGSIPTTVLIDGQKQMIPTKTIDRVRETRDKMISNSKGNRAYYYSIKDLMSTGSVEASKYVINDGELTTAQSTELHDMQSKVRGNVNSGTGSSGSTSWMSPEKQITMAITAAMGSDVTDMKKSRITEACILRFEDEDATTLKARKVIIDECINDQTDGEEGGSGPIDDDDITLGESKKQGVQEKFIPDEPDNLADGSKWSNDVDAWVRPDKSEYGVTLQDGFGRDITPYGLEAGTKWNNDLKRFVRKDKDRLYISDKRGKPLLEVSKKAVYRNRETANMLGIRSKSGVFVDLVRYDNGGITGERPVVYSLEDGSIIE